LQPKIKLFSLNSGEKYINKKKFKKKKKQRKKTCYNFRQEKNLVNNTIQK